MHSLECELIPLTTGLGVRATDCRTKPRNEKGSKAEKFTRLCPYGDVNLNSPSFTIWTRLAGGCRRQYSPFLADSSSRTHTCPVYHPTARQLISMVNMACISGCNGRHAIAIDAVSRQAVLGNPGSKWHQAPYGKPRVRLLRALRTRSSY